ncbi:MAG: EAL domain-containing protein, partial [Cucumibacter sp.]
VTRTLLRHRLVPHQLVLEFTESVFIQHDQARVRETLTTLAELGVGLAIDDFGAGFSGLSYLNDLPFGRLKIDRSYVTGAGTEEKRAALLHGIISLARAVGLLIIAEGVESAEDADLARVLGCHVLQGFYFGGPQPAESFPPRAMKLAAGHAQA